MNRYALKQHNIFPPEQMIGKTDYDIFPKGIANTYRFNDKNVLETKQPIINMEEEMILPDGTIFRFSPINSHCSINRGKQRASSVFQ
ncbi:PAS domain-containing protein [Prosthecochloris sp. SCSIO W1101]|uniref:PAS domain-containing protein n=1 Tax=Prosthecochloris sp. SCSIO W1101 TaxID=2992242 RepID=UPI0039FD411D